MNDPKQHRVACGVLIKTDKVLLCHRSSQKQWFPNVWDFPGGHLEVGETALSALQRELQEELGIVVSEAHFLREVQSTPVHLSYWRVTEWQGEVSNAAPEEHDQLGWFDLAALESLTLADDFYLELIAEALEQ